MTAQVLTGVAGVLLSLAFAYIPGLKTWFANKESTTKRLVMAGVLLVATVGAFVLACWQPERFSDLVVCSDTGFLDLVWLYIVALISNQSAYSLAVK